MACQNDEVQLNPSVKDWVHLAEGFQQEKKPAAICLSSRKFLRRCQYSFFFLLNFSHSLVPLNEKKKKKTHPKIRVGVYELFYLRSLCNVNWYLRMSILQHNDVRREILLQASVC